MQANNSWRYFRRYHWRNTRKDLWINSKNNPLKNSRKKKSEAILIENFTRFFKVISERTPTKISKRIPEICEKILQELSLSSHRKSYLEKFLEQPWEIFLAEFIQKSWGHSIAKFLLEILKTFLEEYLVKFLKKRVGWFQEESLKNTLSNSFKENS